MKVAVVLAVAGAIVGELIASEEGLGYLMLQVQVTLDTAAMFMAVLLITAVGVILCVLVLVLVVGLERLLVVRDARCRWNLAEGARGVQLAEAGLASRAERRWIDLPELEL